jgi:hypothetical protein
MTKKRLLVSLVLVACLAAAGYAVVRCFVMPAPGVTAENFALLRAEMSAEETDGLFGGPCDEQVPYEPGDFADHQRIWRRGDDTIRVAFTKQGKVCAGTATFAGRSAILVHHPSLTEKLSRLFHR